MHNEAVVVRIASSEPAFLAATFDAYWRRLRDEANGIHPLKGLAPGPGDILLRSNDYLGLSRDSRLIEAVIAKLEEVGHGESAARNWSQGLVDGHRRFEFRLAGVMGADDAVLFGSGYAANVGTIQSLCQPGVPLYIDGRAHLSLYEGARSAGVKPCVFRHNDAGSAEKRIRRHGPGLIAVDALYSTDGALCPIRDFIAVAERTGSVLIVDETHSVGTIGRAGGGLCQALGVADRVPFRTLGLSKAVPGRGGAVVCSARAAEFLRNSALPQIFSTAVLPHEIAGFDAVLDIFAAEPWRRKRLHENHVVLRDGLDGLGYNVLACDAQIIALEAGDTTAAIRLRDALEQRGVFGAIFFPPAVPANRCSIRFSLSCGHSAEQLGRILDACAAVRDAVGMARWRSTLRRERDMQGWAERRVLADAVTR